MPGFGVAVKARSGVASYVVQWRERDGGASHRLVLARCCRITLDVARKLARTGSPRSPPAGTRSPSARPSARCRPSPSSSRATSRARPGRRRRRHEAQRPGPARPYPAAGAGPPAPDRDHARSIVEALHRDLMLHGARRGPGAQGRRHQGGPARRAGWRPGDDAVPAQPARLAVKQRLIATNPAAGLELGTDGRRTAIPDAGAYARLWTVLEELRAGRRHHGQGMRRRRPDRAHRRQEVGDPAAAVAPSRPRGARDPVAGGRAQGRQRTGAERVIALSDAAIAILASYQRGLPDALVFPGQLPGVAVDLARPWARIAKAARACRRRSPCTACGMASGPCWPTPACRAMQVASALGHAQRGRPSATATRSTMRGRPGPACRRAGAAGQATGGRLKEGHSQERSAVQLGYPRATADGQA